MLLSTNVTLMVREGFVYTKHNKTAAQGSLELRDP